MCAADWEISEGWVRPPQLVGLCPYDEHEPHCQVGRPSIKIFEAVETMVARWYCDIFHLPIFLYVSF